MHWANLTHSLLVQAVYVAGLTSQDVGQLAIRFDSNRMSGIRWEFVAVCVWALARKVGVENAISHSSHELHSIADPEDRYSAIARSVEERFVEGELLRCDQLERRVFRPPFGHRILGHVVGWKIISARNEQTV
jgi:hypothetical protein